MAQEGYEGMIEKALLVLFLIYIILISFIIIKLLLEYIDVNKTSKVLQNDELRAYIAGFINYVEEIPKDLIVKVNYSTFVGWKIKVHKKGSDMPFINVHNKDVKKAFEEAYKLLKDKENEDEKF